MTMGHDLAIFHRPDGSSGKLFRCGSVDRASVGRTARHLAGGDCGGLVRVRDARREGFGAARGDGGAGVFRAVWRACAGADADRSGAEFGSGGSVGHAATERRAARTSTRHATALRSLCRGFGTGKRALSGVVGWSDGKAVTARELLRGMRAVGIRTLIINLILYSHWQHNFPKVFLHY